MSKLKETGSLASKQATLNHSIFPYNPQDHKVSQIQLLPLTPDTTHPFIYLFIYYTRHYSRHCGVGARQRRGKSQEGKKSEKSEKKESDRGTKGKTSQTHPKQSMRP